MIGGISASIVVAVVGILIKNYNSKNDLKQLEKWAVCINLYIYASWYIYVWNANLSLKNC